MTLSACLRDTRQRAGLGVRQAARLAGCTHAAILHAETGRRVPEDPLLRALATVYGADADELYRLAGRVPADVRELLLAEPGRLAMVRSMWVPRTAPPMDTKAMFDLALKNIRAMSREELLDAWNRAVEATQQDVPMHIYLPESDFGNTEETER